MNLRALLVATLAAAGPTLRAQPQPERAPSAGASASTTPASGPALAPLDKVAEAQLREQALGVLVDWAERGEPTVRAHALEGLVPVPSRLEIVVRRGLVDPVEGVRAVAAMSAGKARLASVAEFIRPLLSDGSGMVRASAIVALTQIAGSPAGRQARVEAPDPSPLAQMLWSRNTREQAQAAYALGEMGNKSALPMLREAVRQPMARASANEKRLAQLQMHEAMAKLGDDSVLGEIRAALYPSSPTDLEVAALAAQVIGEVGDKQSVMQLDYLCQARASRTGDEGEIPPEVRLAAAASIGKLGDPMGIPTATQFMTATVPAHRAAAALALGEAGSTYADLSLPHLQVAINDPDPAVQVAVAAAVLKITDQR